MRDSNQAVSQSPTLAPNVRFISLSQGKVAIVDADLFDWLNQWKWSYMQSKDKRTGYAMRVEDGHSILMHRLIMGAAKGEQVDHKDGNGVNNARKNLRRCSRSGNQHNKPKPRGAYTSQFKGVFWDKQQHQWRARIGVGGQRIHLGWFPSEIDAARAYDDAARIHHGEFAKLNFE